MRDVPAGQGLWGCSAEKARAVPQERRGWGSDCRLRAGQGEAGSGCPAHQHIVIGPSFSQVGVDKVPGQWLLSRAEAYTIEEKAAAGLGWVIPFPKQQQLPSERVLQKTTEPEPASVPSPSFYLGPSSQEPLNISNQYFLATRQRNSVGKKGKEKRSLTPTLSSETLRSAQAI